VYADSVLAMVPLVLDKDIAFGAEGKVTVGGDVAAVEKVNVLEDDEGADEGGFDSVGIGGEDAYQLLGEAVPEEAQGKVFAWELTNCLATGNETGDAEMGVLGDDALNVGGGRAERLDTGKQGGVGKYGRGSWEVGDVTSGGFTTGAVFYAAEGLNGGVLVGVDEALFKTVRVREYYTRRNILLVVKMGERRQWARRRTEGDKRVGTRCVGTEAGVGSGGGFGRDRGCEFFSRQGFYSFCNSVVINGGRAAVTVGEPVCFSTGRRDNGAVDGGDRDGAEWSVGRSDGVRVL
jgi:hypothetical protein